MLSSRERSSLRKKMNVETLQKDPTFKKLMQEFSRASEKPPIFPKEISNESKYCDADQIIGDLSRLINPLQDDIQLQRNYLINIHKQNLPSVSYDCLANGKIVSIKRIITGDINKYEIARILNGCPYPNEQIYLFLNDNVQIKLIQFLDKLNISANLALYLAYYAMKFEEMSYYQWLFNIRKQLLS